MYNIKQILNKNVNIKQICNFYINLNVKDRLLRYQNVISNDPSV